MIEDEGKLDGINPVALCCPMLGSDFYSCINRTIPVPDYFGNCCFDLFYMPVPRTGYRKNPFQMNIFIEEIGTTPNSTGSQLFVDGRPFCFVVEDGHRDKKVYGETRIPGGRYQIIPRYEGSFFEKYRREHGHKFSIQIANVPGFEFILIHIGNTIADTKGCLLVNRNIGIQTTPRDYKGTDSTSVYKLLYSLIEAAFERNEEVWIEIQRRDIIDENTPVG